MSGVWPVPIRVGVWRIAVTTASGTPVPIGLTAGLFLPLIW
jgi:hypothetical protein